MKSKWRNIVILVLLSMILSSCGNTEKNVEVEIGDIIFENDAVKITAVSTDEYLEVFKTEEIKLAYFASDGYPVVLDLGGATLSILQNDEKLYNELERSVLTIYQDNDETDVTDMLAEFYIAKKGNGTIVMYYEIYNEYAESEEDTVIMKYLNLKAFQVEFKSYTDLEEQFI